MKLQINSLTDARTFVTNSGIENWEFSGKASVEDFAKWVRKNCDQIDAENYENELTSYLVSVGENPIDYING